MDTKSCSATENRGKVIEIKSQTGKNISEDDNNDVKNDDTGVPKFALRENDYVFGAKKMGGNAQSIVKDGWLHHTSFLWDYDVSNMEYLTIPEKQPEYRSNRRHDDFLIQLSTYFGKSNRIFFQNMLQTCEETYTVEKITLSQVMDEVINCKLGGMDEWYTKNRTRVLTDL